MLKIVAGMVMEVIEANRNADSSILVTLAGMLMDVIEAM
jgi:hypothetical protein